MSPPGRPKGEYRKAQPEGAPVSPPGHPKDEYRRAQPEGTPVTGALHTRASFTLGMPQLDACGLSENWLQKTCGDRHWQALARLVGRAPTQWRDAQGERVYAAFTYLRLSGARLAVAHEGQRLTIASRLQPASRAQVHGRHRVIFDGQAIGVLDLVSSFVAREAPGSNRRVRRIDGLLAPHAPHAEASALQARARALRAQLCDTGHAASVPLVVQPCPRHDFNGAGLLYFASFGAWVDRALWQWGRLTPRHHVLERECVFLGNADAGEAMRIRLLAAEARGATTAWTLALTTVADARPLAVTRLVASGPLAPQVPPVITEPRETLLV
jgi:probable biosynthetic protein (TIGR04099 family)